MWEKKAEGDMKSTMFRIYHKTVTDFTPNFTFAAGFNFTVWKDKAEER